MILDLEKTHIEAGNFDVCIVGAGAAGLYLAMQLIGHGMRVLLLEGGAENRFERRSKTLNKSEIVGLPFAGAHSGRSRNLGGSTATWAGQIMELDEMDFGQRSWVPGSGWPITKADLVPFYAKAREFEGLTSCYLDDAEFLAARGIEPPDFGDDLTFAYSRYCRELDFARICEAALRDDPNLVTCVHANAVAMKFGGDMTIESVRCRTVTGKSADFSTKRFVFCLGGIESSRFLLQALGDATPPWNKSGLLGRHFQPRSLLHRRHRGCQHQRLELALRAVPGLPRLPLLSAQDQTVAGRPGGARRPQRQRLRRIRRQHLSGDADGDPAGHRTGVGDHHA